MNVGVLGGTGPAGKGLAARLASVGVEVVLGSRSQERAQQACDSIWERWPDRNLTVVAGDNVVAAEADLVVLATPWEAAAATAASVAKQLDAKVVISMANAITRMGHEFEPLVPPRGSVAAHVQSAVPGALVTAALHHLPARSLADLDVPVESDVLICSDHPSAYDVAAGLVDLIPGLRPLNAGSLSNAAPIEAITAVLLQLNTRYHTRAALRFTGIDV